jgi:5-enolpyruvylshikimate-3-phosphate synthase
MTERAIAPLERGFDVTLELPGSKSLTNRYLLLAALASGTRRSSAP